MTSIETGRPFPEEGEIRQPTEEEITARAKTLISEVMDLPKKGREKYYAMRLSALEKLIMDLKEYPPEVEYMEDDEEGEGLPEEGKEAQEILEQYYPGYTISDLEDLRGELPDGLDMAHILSKIANEYIDRVNMHLTKVVLDAENDAKNFGRPRDVKREVAEARERLIAHCSIENLINFVKEWDGEWSDEEMPTAFLGLDSQMTDDDWNVLIEFIKNKFETPRTEVFEIIKQELEKNKS